MLQELMDTNIKPIHMEFNTDNHMLELTKELTKDINNQYNI